MVYNSKKKMKFRWRNKRNNLIPISLIKQSVMHHIKKIICTHHISYYFFNECFQCEQPLLNNHFFYGLANEILKSLNKLSTF